MKSQTVEKVKEGLQTFQRIIKFHSTESASLVIKKAISEDPKILFYLKSYNIKGKQDEYEINAQYIHRDTIRTDVHVVSNRIVCEELICAFAGKYRNELIIITTSNYELRGLIDTFQEKYASFYPNLICVEGEKYRLNSEYYAFKFGYKYRIGYVKLAQMELETEAEVKRIASTLFIPGIPVEAKIYLAHNYLASNVEYKVSNENRLDRSYTQSAYGALVNKHCSCQGYAEAFKRLMDSARIECFVIYGRTNGSSVLHAWNIVSL